jgi:hypothetical protein
MRRKLSIPESAILYTENDILDGFTWSGMYLCEYLIYLRKAISYSSETLVFIKSEVKESTDRPNTYYIAVNTTLVIVLCWQQYNKYYL